MKAAASVLALLALGTAALAVVVPNPEATTWTHAPMAEATTWTHAPMAEATTWTHAPMAEATTWTHAPMSESTPAPDMGPGKGNCRSDCLRKYNPATHCYGSHEEAWPTMPPNHPSPPNKCMQDWERKLQQCYSHCPHST